MERYLTFWGTRGSCPVSGVQYRHFGGNTSCVEVRYGDSLIIIDSGSGIHPLGNKLLEEKVRKINIFLTHTHWDHIIGFPFFKPLYHEESEIVVWAPQGSKRSSQALFEAVFAEEFFPIRLGETKAKLEFRSIEIGASIAIGDLAISSHPTSHPYSTLCFKIKTPKQAIGYVSDNELKIPFHIADYAPLIDFYRGSDLFIHEAQYAHSEHQAKCGWGHSSSNEVIALIQEILPKKWLVTHHDPDYTDLDLKYLYKQTKKLLRKNRPRCPVEWVGDGTTIELI